MDAIGIARALRVQLTALGFEVSHSQALELLAKSGGWKDWNTLSAQSEPTPAVRSGLYCPHCGKQGVVSVAASVFVEQGPYENDRYAFEGQADHYVCDECGGQFVNWESVWPELRDVSDLLCLLEEKNGSWSVVLYRLELVLTGLIGASGEEPEEESVIARARAENAALVRSGTRIVEGPVHLIEELDKTLRERVFVGGSPEGALRAMRQELSREDLTCVVGLPENLRQ